MNQLTIEADKRLEKQYPVIPQLLWYPTIISTLIWVCKCIFVMITPLHALAITTWLIDDSFIFMRIARNLALGRGYSFDSINPTSGAPLLWTLLSSLNHIFLDLEAAAKATVITSSLFGAISAILVFYIAYQVFNIKAAWGAFFLSTLSTPMFLNSMNGMGTSLFTFLGLLAVSLYINADKFQEDQRKYWFFAIGTLLGLTNLTRADGMFLTLAVLFLEGLNLLKTDVKKSLQSILLL